MIYLTDHFTKLSTHIGLYVIPLDIYCSLLAKTSSLYRESLVITHNDLVSPDTQSHMGSVCQTAGYQLRPYIAYSCAL